MADQPTNITPTATGEPAGPYDTDRQAADDCREVHAVATNRAGSMSELAA